MAVYLRLKNDPLDAMIVRVDDVQPAAAVQRQRPGIEQLPG
jgi:hypothetical protein